MHARKDMSIGKNSSEIFKNSPSANITGARVLRFGFSSTVADDGCGCGWRGCCETPYTEVSRDARCGSDRCGLRSLKELGGEESSAAICWASESIVAACSKNTKLRAPLILRQRYCSRWWKESAKDARKKTPKSSPEMRYCVEIQQ